MSVAGPRFYWLRFAPVLLLLSVALNLLLIGAFAGRWTMMPHPPPPGPGMLRHMIDEMGQGMSGADRAVLERVYQAHATGLEEQWDQHRTAFDAIRHAMAAQPFDRAALERALDAAAQLSPDGRQRMAGWQPGPP